MKYLKGTPRNNIGNVLGRYSTQLKLAPQRRGAAAFKNADPELPPEFSDAVSQYRKSASLDKRCCLYHTYTDVVVCVYTCIYIYIHI